MVLLEDFWQAWHSYFMPWLLAYKEPKNCVSPGLYFFIGLGLALALISALLGIITGEADFMTAVWMKFELGGFSLKLGSPLLFDLGVYFLVAGMLVKVIFSVMEEDI